MQTLCIPRWRLISWLLAILVIIGLPVCSFLYWPQVLASGALPHDSDSISIPMMGSLFATVFPLTPLVFGLTFACTWKGSGPAHLLGWRRDRPVLSWTVTVAFGVSALMAFTSILLTVIERFPWYEYLWSAYALVLGLWFTVLRAGALVPKA